MIPAGGSSAGGTIMSRDISNGSGTVMLAFVVGALTGAAVALLFAPATGEETREYLGKKAKESADRARVAVDQSRQFYRNQRENLTSAIDRGREAFHQARERGEQA
jgi:gas vesicle protein